MLTKKDIVTMLLGAEILGDSEKTIMIESVPPIEIQGKKEKRKEEPKEEQDSEILPVFDWLEEGN
jgi:hypothetical protein